MKIVKNLVPADRYDIKCPYPMTPTRIVVHNTANDAPAENEIAYMIRNDYDTSFHYAVDDEKVVQGIEENRNAWHSSDGANGKGNREGIAIEICYSLSGGERFIKAEQNAVELIVDILKRYNWGIDRVTKHQDYCGKYCPHRTLDMGWDRFIKMIEEKLNADKVIHKEPVKSVDELAREVIAGKYGNGNARRQALGDRYAEVQKRVDEILTGKPATPVKKSVDEIAKEVIQGKWGVGADRKNRLTQAGYNYNEVQAKVDDMLKPATPKLKPVKEIAREVIQGKWGNGADRKKRLTNAGYDYAEVQAEVNKYFK